MWQLGRADYKKALRNAEEANAALPVLSSDDFLARLPAAKDVHRRAKIKGQWVPDNTVYWDNIPMSGKVGYVILSPLKLSGCDGVVLVQRGWVQRNFLDREQLVPVESPAGEVEVSGVIAPLPSQRIELGGPESGRIRQNPPVAEYRKRFGNQFAEVSLRQTDAAMDGLVREWARPDDGVNMHLGYAFQWFMLSALVVVYYVWFQIVKRKRTKFTA